MALPLLIFLLLPAHNHALKIYCDPTVRGEWLSECDFMQINGQVDEQEVELAEEFAHLEGGGEKVKRDERGNICIKTLIYF
jgi:hypothetical protein